MLSAVMSVDIDAYWRNFVFIQGAYGRLESAQAAKTVGSKLLLLMTVHFLESESLHILQKIKGRSSISFHGDRDYSRCR